MARTTKDEKGRIKEVIHNKCWYIRAKKVRTGPTGRHGDPPTVYEQAQAELLARRQAEIAAERALEDERTTEVSDWRDPTTMEV